MAKYLKLFTSTSDYNTYIGGSPALPNVSLCTDTNGVHFTALVPVTGITLDKQTITLDAGNHTTLTATVAPNDASDKSVTWTSSDSTKVSITGSGATVQINGLAAAQGVTITCASASDPTKSATCSVTVTQDYGNFYIAACPWTENSFNPQESVGAVFYDSISGSVTQKEIHITNFAHNNDKLQLTLFGNFPLGTEITSIPIVSDDCENIDNIDGETTFSKNVSMTITNNNEILKQNGGHYSPKEYSSATMLIGNHVNFIDPNSPAIIWGMQLKFMGRTINFDLYLGQ